MTRRALRTLRGRSLLRIEPLEDRLLLAVWPPYLLNPVPTGTPGEEAAPPSGRSPQQPAPGGLGGAPLYYYSYYYPWLPPLANRHENHPDHPPGEYQVSPDGQWLARRAAAARAPQPVVNQDAPTPPPPPAPPPATRWAEPKEGGGHSPPPVTELPSQPAAPLDPEEAEPPADAPEAKPQAEQDDPPPVGLPGLAADGWEQAGRQLLRALETLRTAGDEGDSVWLRLAAWSLAGASSFVLYELTRQQLRERRRGFAEAPFAEDRWRR